LLDAGVFIEEEVDDLPVQDKLIERLSNEEDNYNVLSNDALKTHAILTEELLNTDDRNPESQLEIIPMNKSLFEVSVGVNLN
jgi:hypothetical protein